jgi:hypothetical protein
MSSISFEFDNTENDQYNSMDSYTTKQTLIDIEMGLSTKKSIPEVEISNKKQNYNIVYTENKHPKYVIKDLESQQYIVIQKAMNSTPDKAVNTLLNFMSDGAKDFENKTGRKMTYAEIRSAWG